MYSRTAAVSSLNAFSYRDGMAGLTAVEYRSEAGFELWPFEWIAPKTGVRWYADTG